MGRRRKNNTEIEFLYHRKFLPDMLKEVLDEQEMNGVEDLILLMLKEGYDPEKFFELPQYVADLDCLTLDDLAIEKGSYAAYLHHRLQEFENDNFSTMPSGLLLGKECSELYIRIRLNNAPVLIWRELFVPSNLSLELLALILMKAMGWQNVHPHQFRQGDTLFKNTNDLRKAQRIPTLGKRPAMFDTNKIAVGNLLKEKGDRMKFEYDFGDSWEHEVWVKGIREYEEDEEPEAVLVKGAGACPPDDCGGVWGYEELLNIRQKKRKKKEEKEMLEWFGIDHYFDPCFFGQELAEEAIEDVWRFVKDEPWKYNQ